MNQRAVVGSSVCIILFLFFLLPPAGAAVRLGFKAYGGLNYLGGGDLNRGTEGLTNGLIWYVHDILPGASTPGEYAPARWGIDFGGDIILDLSSSFALSIGAGYLQSSRSTLLAFYSISPLSSLSISPEARASAVCLSVQAIYTLPTTSGLSVVFHAGPGYYLASIRSYNELVSNGSTIMSFDTEADGGGLGVQAGLGLQYDLNSHWAFFLEVNGRYAAFSGFEGTTKLLVGALSVDYSGILYCVTRSDIMSGPQTMIRCAASFPTGPDYVEVHEAKVDLSGFSLRLGAVIRLGPSR